MNKESAIGDWPLAYSHWPIAVSHLYNELHYYWINEDWIILNLRFLTKCTFWFLVLSICLRKILMGKGMEFRH